MTAYLLGALLFVVAIVIFVMQNTGSVIVHFITWTTPEISIALVTLIAACAGALVMLLVNTYRAFKIGQKMKELLKENRKYQKELESLKSKQTADYSKSSAPTAESSKDSIFLNK